MLTIWKGVKEENTWELSVLSTHYPVKLKLSKKVKSINKHTKNLDIGNNDGYTKL